MLDRTTGRSRSDGMFDHARLRPLRSLPRARRVPTALVCTAISVAAWSPALGQAPTAAAATAGAATARTDIGVALTPLIEPIKARRVVRRGLVQADVWLISELGFDETATRVQKAISTQMALSGGFVLARWTYIDADRSYRLDVTGPRAVRVRLTRHLEGTLWELEAQGDAREAGKWAPPFRPRAIPLFHGPLR